MPRAANFLAMSVHPDRKRRDVSLQTSNQRGHGSLISFVDSKHGMDGPFAGRSVTTFVSRLGRKVKERTGKNRTNGTTQAVNIALIVGKPLQ